MIGWKAFRYTGGRNLRFLFHAHNGSSVVPFNQWIEAKQKWVKEGSGRRYRSGFHFFRSPNDTDRFNKLTKNKYWILRIRVEGIRQKPRSSESWLARRIFVPYPFQDRMTD